MVYYNGRKLESMLMTINRQNIIIESVPLYDITVSPYDEKYITENKSYFPLDQNTSTPSGMHMMSDGNHLYIWVGNKWKRVILSDF
jgi:hypothetical protein